MVDQKLEESRNYLESVAEIIKSSDWNDDETLQHQLDVLSGTGIVSQLELLLPGDQILPQNGERIDAEGLLSFKKEAEDGFHISFHQELAKQSLAAVRACLTIEKDGETAAVLCATLDLKHLADIFPGLDYGAEMQFFIIERETRQFLLDTWHEHSANMDEMQDRRAAKGYSREQFTFDFSQGNSGVTVFRSEKANENFYTGYAPVHEEDWMVVISVPASIAFSNAANIRFFFFGLTAAMIAVFSLYFFWTVHDIQQEKLESEKNLKNVTYILDVERNLFFAHTQPEHFRDALQAIASFTTAEVAFFWGDFTFGQSRLWSSRGAEQLKHDTLFQEQFPELFVILQEKGEAICKPGELYLEKDLTQHEDFLRWNVKNYMMVPVRRQDGKTIGVLGAVNMKRRWKTAEPLEQVALSFSITAEQCASYQRLDQMSQTDAMTGLMNRNRYHEILREMEQEPYCSFACVYVDANGLHEINNRLGHLEGDQMLIRMANTLKEKFISEPVFRIGGDEFVVLCRNRERQWVYDQAEAARIQVKKYGYEMSVGIEWRNQHMDVMDIVNTAEARMRLDKQQYYKNNGSERQNRVLDEKTARLIAEKQDMDTFLAVLAPQFKGIYFVDLSKDTIRYLFIPSYFKDILREEDGKFSKGLLHYSSRLVKSEYQGLFEDFCNYDYLKKRLEQESALEFRYQKKDGIWLKLQVLQVNHSKETEQETLWLFSTAEP